jgi:hypothetical protein
MLLKPKNDLVFKALFGQEKDKRLLTGFLRATLDIALDEDEITINNPIRNINPHYA